MVSWTTKQQELADILCDAGALGDSLELIKGIGCPEKALVEFEMVLLCPTGEAMIMFSLIQMTPIGFTLERGTF